VHRITVYDYLGRRVDVASGPDYPGRCERGAAAGCLICGANLREVSGGFTVVDRRADRGMRRRRRDTCSRRAGRKCRSMAPLVQTSQPRWAGLPDGGIGEDCGIPGIRHGQRRGELVWLRSCPMPWSRPRHRPPAGRTGCRAGRPPRAAPPEHCHRRSLSPSPSRPRSEPTRPPGCHAAARVFPPPAASCCSTGSAQTPCGR
jgi:hypothetical protein